MISMYELLTIIAIDILLIFDENSGPSNIKLKYGSNPSMFSLLRHPSGKGLNTFLGSSSMPIKLDDVKDRKWAHVKSPSMKYTSIEDHIIGHDYDRFDVTKGLSDFLINDDFMHEILLHAYKRMGSTISVIDKSSNPLVNNMFIQTIVLNLAYFIFISNMEYGNNAMKMFLENRSMINSPQWWVLVKRGNFSAKAIQASLKMQLSSSSAITNSMNRKLKVMKGTSALKANNAFLNNGPSAMFPTNLTLVYLVDLNNNMFKYISEFSEKLHDEIGENMLDSSSSENANIFRINNKTAIEKKMAIRFKAYMYIMTESIDQFESLIMSGGAWLSDNKAGYLATWRFSNTRLSKDIFKTIDFKNKIVSHTK